MGEMARRRLTIADWLAVKAAYLLKPGHHWHARSKTGINADTCRRAWETGWDPVKYPFAAQPLRLVYLEPDPEDEPAPPPPDADPIDAIEAAPPTTDAADITADDSASLPARLRAENTRVVGKGRRNVDAMLDLAAVVTGEGSKFARKVLHGYLTDVAKDPWVPVEKEVDANGIERVTKRRRVDVAQLLALLRDVARIAQLAESMAAINIRSSMLVLGIKVPTADPDDPVTPSDIIREFAAYRSVLVQAADRGILTDADRRKAIELGLLPAPPPTETPAAAQEPVAS